jgi:hypothetical protein
MGDETTGFDADADGAASLPPGGSSQALLPWDQNQFNCLR